MAAKSTTIVVEHETDLHTHSASMSAQAASKFETDVSMRKADGEMEADAKNSIAALSLGIDPNEEVTITADDNDGKQAIERLVELVRNDFDLDT